MICLDSKKTVEILLSNINLLKEKWSGKEGLIHLKPFEVHRENHLKKVIHTVNFRDTGFVKTKPMKILFSHFPLTKYEMESIEMPLYASRVFPKSKIDSVYFDSRGRITNNNTHYLTSLVGGNISIPREKNDFEDSYDLMITKSSTITTMKKRMPKVLDSCKYKVNIQTNNYAPNLDVGEDYRFCYTDFFAPAGRKFTDRAQSLMSQNGFGKMELVVMTGTVIWWKGQTEWVENVDPELLKDKVILIFGGISDHGYFHRLIQSAQSKNISLLYSEYVNPDFLCDVLCFSRIKIMNHYADPGDGQPALGPSRTFGEAIACQNICLHGQTYNNDNKEGIGKNICVPAEWNDYTIEYDQSKKDNFNTSLEKALSTNLSNIDFEKTISVEEKCDQIFEKCLNLSGLTDENNRQ